jgi:hypothetical protein
MQTTPAAMTVHPRQGQADRIPGMFKDMVFADLFAQPAAAHDLSRLRTEFGDQHEHALLLQLADDPLQAAFPRRIEELNATLS